MTLAANGTFPPVLGRRIAQRVSVGLLVAAALSLVLAIGFSLNAIASIGSAVALLVFGMCTVAHFRVRSETGARLSLLILVVTTAGIALAAFLLDLIIIDPVSVAAMLVIVLLAVILDLAWKRARAQRAPVSGPAPTVAPSAVEETGSDPSHPEHGGPAPTATWSIGSLLRLGSTQDGGVQVGVVTSACELVDRPPKPGEARESRSAHDGPDNPSSKEAHEHRGTVRVDEQPDEKQARVDERLHRVRRIHHDRPGLVAYPGRAHGRGA